VSDPYGADTSLLDEGLVGEDHQGDCMSRSREVLVFAHRGGMTHGRGNTLTTFGRGLEMGADGLESDVWLTADGVPVLDHDGRVGRPWRRRRIAEVKRAQLPRHMPSLADLYAHCGSDFELALDVCDERSVPAVLATAAAKGPSVVSRLWLCSGSIDRLASWRELKGEARSVCSRDSWRGGPQELEDALGRLGSADVAALNLRGRHCTAEIVRTCHAHDLSLFAWGVGSSGEAMRLVSMGLDGLFGDDVGALTRAARPGMRRSA
jgi:glycerophosphoryl diester phosphodiesterase